MIELNHYYNCDCMDLMKQLPNKYVDLAIVDPPYGIGIHKMSFTKSGAVQIGTAKRNDYTNIGDWDENSPSAEYFTELFRVSKEQIIWGGNYFTDILPPTKSWIVWDKRCEDKYSNDFADCELAWCSNNGSITGKDAAEYLGIMSFTKRISEMRRKGYPLSFKWETSENRYGEKVRYKRWYFV